MIVPLTSPASEFHWTRSPTLNGSVMGVFLFEAVVQALPMHRKDDFHRMKKSEILLAVAGVRRASDDSLAFGRRPAVQVLVIAHIMVACGAFGGRVFRREAGHDHHAGGVALSRATSMRRRCLRITRAGHCGGISYSH
jgi:hypothetical protein